MSILFQPMCFSSSGSDHSNIRKINYKLFLNGVCFIRPKLPLFFRPPTLFLQGLRFLNQVSILFTWSPFILFNQCSYPVVLMKMFFKFIILHSRILFRWIQLKLSVLIIALSSFQMLSHAGVPFNHPLLAIHLFWSAEDISEDFCLHY